ncbi:demethoxyubiquinone hydroxylase family protein [Sphingomonas sp. AP4-R1]|nr:demethoxyubiquinone hydroxylase family protein [Sphingomonas sp. AP4-R1]
MSDAPGPLIPPSKRERDAMIRVDQAGEFGATRIYAGQLAILGDRHPASRAIARMAAQEQNHLARFNALMTERRVRPTLLAPVWHVAGHALGAVTALISPEAAMACTAAIETEIDLHYEDQRRTLGPHDPKLGTMIAEFQAEEVEHRETAIAAGAERAPAYPVLSAAIRMGCRAAIAISKRI